MYQTQVPKGFELNNPGVEIPYRILPGRLSVSRAIGDPEAKLEIFGGNPNVLICEPDVFEVKLSDKIDFILLGCDGIFDNLGNKEIVDGIWEMSRSKHRSKDFHKQCALTVDLIMKAAMAKRSMDNVTVIFIAFDNFEQALEIGNDYIPMKTEASATPKSKLSMEKKDLSSLKSGKLLEVKLNGVHSFRSGHKLESDEVFQHAKTESSQRNLYSTRREGETRDWVKKKLYEY